MCIRDRYMGYSMDVSNPKFREGNILLSMIAGNNIQPVKLPAIRIARKRSNVLKFPKTYRTLSLLKERIVVKNGDGKEKLKQLLEKLRSKGKRMRDIKAYP
eukprot:TRINITY_DN7170_c0_g1_i1.p1 TRINITY_DN7170_c0_g1~~TRINITY_DN7170_c0_g1_i1.p1  ORF type:complete len:101 (-),score=26.27 TRINITY_DN7170_c0_g1_i1:30-332(-)